MGSVVQLKLNHYSDHFPLVARYRLEEGGPRFEMYQAYDKLVIITTYDDGKETEQAFEDALEAGLMNWTQLIGAITAGTATDLHFSPEGLKRLVSLSSILASYVMQKRLTSGS